MILDFETLWFSVDEWKKNQNFYLKKKRNEKQNQILIIFAHSFFQIITPK